MGYIFVDKESDGKGQMREQMRRSMRGMNYRHYGDDGYQEGYRMGYRHGWEDSDDDEMEHMRRARDSRGRYI